MRGSSSQGIFLSYRREDAAPYARLLQKELHNRLPRTQIFMDVDSIEPGINFSNVIQNKVHSCKVLVALIGPKWTTLTDEKGHRRLYNRDDYVQFEIKTALECDVRVIPVLVGNAELPQQQELPPGLEKLAWLNAFELSDGRRHQDDMDQLLDVIKKVLKARPSAILSTLDKIDRIAERMSKQQIVEYREIYYGPEQVEGEASSDLSALNRDF